MRSKLLAASLLLVALTHNGRANATEPPVTKDAPVAWCDGLPSWLSLVDIGVGAGLLVPGTILWSQRRITADNPTAPALLTGVGAGLVLSGLALTADRSRACDPGTPPPPSFEKTRRTIVIVTAAEATLALGLSGLFTLTHDSSSAARNRAPDVSNAGYALGGLLIALASMGTTVGMHIVLAPGSAASPGPTVAAVPTQGGATGVLTGSF